MDETYNEDNMVRAGEDPAGRDGCICPPLHSDEQLRMCACSCHDDNPAGGTTPGEVPPRFLIRSSPLVAGGKARLMSNRKVKPNRAKPREVSGAEAKGYTSQRHRALADEPECVGPAILDAYGEAANFFRTQRHVAEVLAARETRHGLPLERRLDDIERRAKQTKVDLRRGLRDARATLRRTRAGGREPKAALVRLVESMEAQLDGQIDEAA